MGWAVSARISKKRGIYNQEQGEIYYTIADATERYVHLEHANNGANIRWTGAGKSGVINGC